MNVLLGDRIGLARSNEDAKPALSDDRDRTLATIIFQYIYRCMCIRHPYDTSLCPSVPGTMGEASKMKEIQFLVKLPRRYIRA